MCDRVSFDGWIRCVSSSVCYLKGMHFLTTMVTPTVCECFIVGVGRGG